MTSRWPSDGEPEILGATLSGNGVNVAVFSANASAIEFCLFDGEREIRRVRLRGRTGDVFTTSRRMSLSARAMDCAPMDRIIPPRAIASTPPSCCSIPMRGRSIAPLHCMLRCSTTGPARPRKPYCRMTPIAHRSCPKGSLSRKDGAEGLSPPITPWSDTVVYELHVRGFSIRNPGIPEPLRGRFAALAHPVAIEHLLRLGVTTVEIMPASAWIAERHLVALGLRNYWGYNPVELHGPRSRTGSRGLG